MDPHSHNVTSGPPACDEDDRPIRSVSVIGAGTMGQGIAAANVRAGMSVRITDADPARAADVARQLGDADRVFPVRPPHFVGRGHRPRIAATTSDEQLGDADLVVEAVPEDAAAKTAVLKRIEPFLTDRTIVATNTSSLSIGQLSASLSDPERFCGLHFCHPVSERPLVEVVVAGKTDEETARRAERYVESLGKTPLRVPDRPGFLLNRLLVPYLNEALELLLSGIGVESLDQAALRFGMPIGPLRHFDEFGIDVALSVGGSLFRAFPDRIVPSELLVAMYKSGRMGRKSGGGFYSGPDEDGGDRLDPAVQEMIRERQRDQVDDSPDSLAFRLFGPMLVEATRALEEAVVPDPALVESALRDGLGMTRQYRGLLAWADSFGAETFVQRLEQLGHLGARFEPTSWLLGAARRGRSIAATWDVGK